MASKSPRRSILKSRNSFGTDTEEIQPQAQQCISIVTVSNTTTSITAKRVSFSSKPEVKEIPNLCVEKQEEFPDMEMTFCPGGDESFSVFETNNENVTLSMDMSMTMIDAVFKETDECSPNAALPAHKNKFHEGSLYEGIENEPISSYWTGTENMEMTFWCGCDTSNFSAFKTCNGNLPYSMLDMSTTALHIDSIPTEAKSGSPTVANPNEVYQVSSSEQNQYEPDYFLETEDMEMTVCGDGEDCFLAFQTYNGNVPLSTQDMSMTVLHEALRKTELKSESPNKVHQTVNETAVNQSSVVEQRKYEPVTTENMEMACWGGEAAFKTYNENPQTVSDMSLTIHSNAEEQSSLIPKDKEPSRSHTSANQDFNENAQPIAFTDTKNQLSKIPIWSCKRFPGNITKRNPKMMLDRVVYSGAARFRKNNVDALRKQLQGSYGKFASADTPKRKIAELKHEVEVQTTPSLANQCAKTPTSIQSEISIPDQMTKASKMGSKDVANISKSVQLADQSEISIPDQMMEGSKMASQDVANISKNVPLADQSEISLFDQTTVGLNIVSEDFGNIGKNVSIAGICTGSEPSFDSVTQDEMARSYSTNTVLMSLLQSYENASGFNTVVLTFKIQIELCKLPDNQFEEFCKVESERNMLPKGVLQSCQLTRSFQTQLDKKLYVQLAENRNANM